MYCNQCGRQYCAGWQYCSGCGTRISIHKREENDDVASRPTRPLGIVQTPSESQSLPSNLMSFAEFTRNRKMQCSNNSFSNSFDGKRKKKKVEIEKVKVC